MDTFLRQGTGHDICQDYILQAPGAIILSDGCSGAPHSDIGARLLCWAARDLLHWYLEPEVLMEGAAQNASRAAQVLGIPDMSLAATLFVMRHYGSHIEVSGFGDIVVAIKRKRQPAIDYHSVEFPSGAPYYPVYYTCPEMGDKYFIDFPNIMNFDGRTTTVTMAKWVFGIEDIEWIALMSDGALTFGGYDGLNELLQFKNLHGEFVKRRCKHFFKKSKLQNYDDFSIGAIAP